MQAWRPPVRRPAVCGHFLPANKQITRQLSSSSAAIILHLGRGDTAGQPRGRTLPGEILAGVLLISSLTPGTRPFKEDPWLNGYSCHLVIHCVWFDRHYIARSNPSKGMSEEQLFEVQRWSPTAATRLSFFGARLSGEGRWLWSVLGTEERICPPHAVVLASPNVSPGAATSPTQTSHHLTRPHLQTPACTTTGLPQHALQKGCKKSNFCVIKRLANPPQFTQRNYF